MNFPRSVILKIETSLGAFADLKDFARAVRDVAEGRTFLSPSLYR
jgi:hypothetical protein